MTPKSTKYSTLANVLEIEESGNRQENSRPYAASNIPLGMYQVQNRIGRRLTFNTHKYLVLLLTFVIYASYHASRRPLNVVKPILSPYDSVAKNAPGCTENGTVHKHHKTKGHGWAPFRGRKGEERLVALDFAFLMSYAIGVFISGRIADRSNLRHFLFWGMLGSGLTVISFGLGYFMKIHSFSFYFTLQICIGLFQSTGWPAVVAIVAQWFGNDNLGFIMGIWNAHASIGNSVGSALSGSVLKHGWGSSFLLLGSLIAFIGTIFWFFLIPQPSDAGFHLQPKKGHSEGASAEASSNPHSVEAISWWRAFAIPGVLPFACALFFTKFVAYTFLFWLPYYITSTCIHGQELSVSKAGDLSILFDLGGILGGACAGYLFDRTNSGALISTVFTIVAIPVMLAYNHLGQQSFSLNLFLLVICGFCVNGPFALITTAISADLGTHESLQGNARALSTVTAIIDGMGSLGAALGPTLTGQILALSPESSFSRVFTMLSVAALISILILSRVTWTEIKALTRKKVADYEQKETEQLVNQPNFM